MADEGGGQAAAGAGAGAGGQDFAAVQGLLSFRPTIFRGTTQDTITIQAWCGTIAKAKLAAGWNDQRARDCATENLRDEAATWYQNVKNGFRADRDAVTTTWAAFEEAITKRFGLDRTAIQKVNLIKDLQQTPTEKVAAFYERVYMTMRKTHGDLIQKMIDTNRYGSANQRTSYADGVEDLQKSVIQVMFLAGLRDDLRQPLQATADFETLDITALRSHAIRIEDSRERTRKEPPKMQIAAVTTTKSRAAAAAPTEGMAEKLRALQAEVNAIRTQGKPKNGNKTGQKTGAQLAKIPIHSRRSWVFCYNCKQWGLHFAAECLRSAQEVGTMQPQDRAAKPQSGPVDRDFPSPN